MLPSLPIEIMIDSHSTIVIWIKTKSFHLFLLKYLNKQWFFRTDRNYVFDISQLRVPLLVAVLFLFFKSGCDWSRLSTKLPAPCSPIPAFVHFCREIKIKSLGFDWQEINISNSVIGQATCRIWTLNWPLVLNNAIVSSIFFFQKQAIDSSLKFKNQI